jgi:hypothetical protein
MHFVNICVIAFSAPKELNQTCRMIILGGELSCIVTFKIIILLIKMLFTRRYPDNSIHSSLRSIQPYQISYQRQFSVKTSKVTVWSNTLPNLSHLVNKKCLNSSFNSSFCLFYKSKFKLNCVQCNWLINAPTETSVRNCLKPAQCQPCPIPINERCLYGVGQKTKTIFTFVLHRTEA